MIDQYDFTADIKAIEQVSPTLVDRIFDAINNYRPLPDLPDEIRSIKILTASSFDAEIVILLSTGTLVVDRTRTHTIVYSNAYLSVEVNCMLGRRSYCWSILSDNDRQHMAELKPSYHCNNRQDMLLKILSGQDFAFVGSNHLLDHLHSISRNTKTGRKISHPAAQFSLSAYTARRFYTSILRRVFKRHSRIQLL
jgi:hypothetical protein